LRGHAHALEIDRQARDHEHAPAGMRERVILMVDDDEEDCHIVRSAVLRLKPAVRFECIFSGDELLTYLRTSTATGERPRPDLILLDLNMPRKNGWETLQEVRSSPEYAGIPVIVLTTSQGQDDVSRSYRAGSNAFVTKPSSRSEMDRLLNTITGFWFGSAQLPS
jgi:chemotaxis family two-component system response regulator Rcp1